MTRVVVVGGGLAGLAAALFLARHEHTVTLVERDGPPGEGDSADEDATNWKRPGAPQSHQSHVLLGRARRVLLEEAPDVLRAMAARGILEHEVRVGAATVEGEAMLPTRRLVAEGVLRRIVEDEPSITVRCGDSTATIAPSRSRLRSPSTTRCATPRVIPRSTGASSRRCH